MYRVYIRDMLVVMTATVPWGLELTIERVLRTCCDYVDVECLGGVASNSY